jgi:glycosyltransferase involved in cell wall biosynthesis
VDARELGPHPTGVGRYLGGLLAEWADGEARRHEWCLYAHRPPSVPRGLQTAVRVLGGAGGTRWEQWTLPRRLAEDRPDVLFSPGYTAPFSAPCPTVLAVHDVSFAAHPEWFSFSEGMRRRVLTRWSARRARHVITISRFSKTEIGRHLGIADDRIHVIPPGMRSVGLPAARPREPMVLYVGSIFARRHVDRLIAAFATHVAPELSNATLEIVGDDRSHPAVDLAGRVARLAAAVRQRVRFRSWVDDDVLGDLYARASVFVFLSEYEGFGLTPLEALSAGVPPVLLETPVAQEVMGPAARYVSLSDGLEASLGAAIVDLITAEPSRQEVLRHAAQVLARYRWDAAAERTLRVLEEAAGA